MDLIRRQTEGSGMTAVAFLLLGILTTVAGIVSPVQAQNHPPALFPYPMTFEINGIYDYGDLLGVQAAAVGDFNGDGKLDVVSIAGGVWEIDVALGNGDGTFQVPIANTYSPPYGTSPYALAVGDFSGNGRLDLAVWCTYAANDYNVVLIFMGNGDGTLTYSNTYPAPNAYFFAQSGSNALYVADFNGDGKLDLAALAPYCTSNVPCVTVYFGNGDGTFQTPVSYSTVDPNHPLEINVFGMAVGDLNGDGKPDIAVTEGNGIAVLLNSGGGIFGTAAYYDSGIAGLTTQTGIAIGDVNGDKRNDIVATSSHLGDVVLFLNQGSGTFVSQGSVAQAPGGGMSWLVNMADINGDKKLDLIVTDGVGEIWTFYGKGNGTFTAGPVYPVQYSEQAPDNVVLADFNGDGALDIFKPLEDHSWDGQVILGRGDGTFQTSAAYGWSETGFGQNVVAADFNGDGYPDVAYSYARSSNLFEPGFEVMLGSANGALGTPAFVPVSTGDCYSFTEWIAAGDVDGDGKADIVTTVGNSGNSGCPNNQVAVLMGNSTGFGAPVYYSTGSTAQSYDVFLEDVNGDGKLDIVISNADGTISVLLNNGKGKFGAAKLITSLAALSPHLHTLTFGDFNGDGTLDIAAATYYPEDQSSAGSNVYVLLGNGDGTFQTPITTAAAPEYVYASTLAAGDFNNDGKMDLLVTLDGSTGPTCTGWSGSAAYAVLLGNGDGTFTSMPFICTAGDFPRYPVVADFNGDGKLDAFIVMQEGTGKNPYGPVLLEGNGDGTFTRLGESEFQWVNGNESEAFKGGYYTGSQDYGAVVADFNGDGTPDIAVLNNDSFYSVDYITFVTVMFNNTLPLSVSPLNLKFGTVSIGGGKTETVLLTNNQTAFLSIKGGALGGADRGDFSLTSSNCKATLKAGWECTASVRFSPKATGVRSATLTITDSVGTQVVQLSGTGK
jgi:hypothetical protein